MEKCIIMDNQLCLRCLRVLSAPLEVNQNCKCIQDVTEMLHLSFPPPEENGWVGEEKDFMPWRTPAVTKTVLQPLCVVLELTLQILHHWEYSVQSNRAGTGINDREYNQIFKHFSE